MGVAAAIKAADMDFTRTLACGSGALEIYDFLQFQSPGSFRAWAFGQFSKESETVCRLWSRLTPGLACHQHVVQRDLRILRRSHRHSSHVLESKSGLKDKNQADFVKSVGECY